MPAPIPFDPPVTSATFPDRCDDDVVMRLE